METPDLNGMVIFAKVVEAQSYTQAAKESGLPKSTISRKVAQMEEQLGVRLLQRNTRSLSLTHVGAKFYEHCANIARELEAAKFTVERTHDGVSGLLRVSLPISFNQDIIASLTSGFLRQYPKVDLDLQFTDGNVNLFAGDFDIDIRYGPLETSELIARLLFERQPVLVASPQYLKAFGLPQTPQQLTQHQGILLGGGQSSAIWALGKGEERTLQAFKRRVRVNSSAVVKQMVQDGVGIGVLSSSVCYKELASGELVQVLPDFPMEPFRVYGLYASRKQLASNITCFLDFFASHFESHENRYVKKMPDSKIRAI